LEAHPNVHFHFTRTSASKADVLERLSERVREQHERFATCDVCPRLFWEGSHCCRMRTLLATTMGRKT